jgi:hypothetical protein
VAADRRKPVPGISGKKIQTKHFLQAQLTGCPRNRRIWPGQLASRLLALSLQHRRQVICLLRRKNLRGEHQDQSRKRRLKKSQGEGDHKYEKEPIWPPGLNQRRRAELEACDQWSAQGQRICVLQMATLVKPGSPSFPPRRFLTPDESASSMDQRDLVTLSLAGGHRLHHPVGQPSGPWSGAVMTPLGPDQVNVLSLLLQSEWTH